MICRIARYCFAKFRPTQTKLFINNEFVDSVSGKTFPTENPATEEVICQVAQANEQDAELAVKAARNAFDHGQWRKLSGYDRGRLMYKLADILEQNSEEMAYLESMDNGKPLSIAQAVDIPYSVKCLRYYAGWADKIPGHMLNLEGPFHGYLRPEPVGVCAQIIPWNFPLLMLAWKWGPLLATGCVSILKPAEQTPLTALKMGEFVKQAGFPPGVINILSGYGDVGAYLVRHNKVDKVAFTGSTEVGRDILANSSKGIMKKVTLELGGKSPNIICHDADLDLAVSQAHFALFFNHGQCCCAGSRLFVHESIYDQFLVKMKEKTKQIKLGNPLEQSTEQGPQVSKEQFDKIMAYIDSGKTQGARLVCGGNKFGKKGFFVEPTVFADVQDEMKICQEEIFGPVMSVLKFKTYDEVIERANNNNYGLGAGIVTKSTETYLKIANALRTGCVWVNCYDVLQQGIAFGGFKDSGIGRELGELGLRNYIEYKTVIVKTSDDTLP